ncbi:MAG: TetR/AcrR family transcriptional regulator [Anaerolineae bacterium]|nr:TetR/AcrR family transcriptional regulator [Anaerolineae bacterium]
MLPEHTDLRIQRTRILLCDTLINLIAEKGFDAISVKDIAERAMINRATFYRHFEDKYALVTYIFKEAIAQMFNEVGPAGKNIEILSDFDAAEDLSSPKMRDAVATLARFFEYFAKNEKLYRSLLGKNGSPWFSAQMCNYLSAIWLQRLQSINLQPKKKSGTPALSAEMVAACLARSVVGMITWWLESGRKETAEEMATGCLLFIAYGYYHALTI